MSDDRKDRIKRNILSPAQWMRILYMAFYAVACWVLLFVLPVIIICQVIISLITGFDNRNLRDFGKALSDYFHDAMDYLVYDTDDKPWPFNDGEDLGESVMTDDDDDDDDDDDSAFAADSESGTDESTTPRAAADSGKSDDDVFQDISFTGAEDVKDASDVTQDDVPGVGDVSDADKDADDTDQKDRV